MYLALCGRPAFAITIATGKGGQSLPMFSLRRLNGPAFAEVSADGGGQSAAYQSYTELFVADALLFY